MLQMISNLNWYIHGAFFQQFMLNEPVFSHLESIYHLTLVRVIAECDFFASTEKLYCDVILITTATKV